MYNDVTDEEMDFANKAWAKYGPGSTETGPDGIEIARDVSELF